MFVFMQLPVCSLHKRDYWHWLEALPELCEHHSGPVGRPASRVPLSGGSRVVQAPSVPVHPMYQLCLAEAKSNACKRVTTYVGRQRLLLRLLLQKKIIVWPFETLVSSKLAYGTPILIPGHLPQIFLPHMHSKLIMQE